MSSKKEIIEKDREKINPRGQLLELCNLYLSYPSINVERYKRPELEVRIGTKGIKQLTKIDYDNVVVKLRSLGFIPKIQEGIYTLKISPEVLDIRTGNFKPSPIRVEIAGIENIQKYCNSNDLSLLMEQETIFNSNVTFTKKTPYYIEDKKVNSADFDDFNFRVAFAIEDNTNKRSNPAKEILQNWKNSKKTFRYIHRYEFTHQYNSSPFRVDLSIVKMSTKNVKTYNVRDSGVFQNHEIYEIEIECQEEIIKTIYNTPEEMMVGLEKMIKNVLCGIQRSTYPISYKQQNSILYEYMRTIEGDDYNSEQRVYPRNFIGPNSKTLQIENIIPENKNSCYPNIRKDFVVTEKADGERHLLFVNGSGNIYLINTIMEVIFTGAKTTNKDCFHSILDGELILHNKYGKYINLFACFDIYYMNKEDVRHFPFIEYINKDENLKTKKDIRMKSRLNLLNAYIRSLNIEIAIKSERDLGINAPIRISAKKFYPVFTPEETLENTLTETAKVRHNIFEACNYILKNIDDGLFEYETDGLIFTPCYLGVGSDVIGKAGPTKKKTWDFSFKWKPPQFNTIDFLVSTKKNADGKDAVTAVFQNGNNNEKVTQFSQYKTLILRCGFDEKLHGYINPCQDVIDDRIFECKEREENKPDNFDYKPVQFFPSNPSDPNAGICNVMLKEDDLGNQNMFTEENEVFEDDTIVEFKYDFSREGFWRWVPLRVRYDKTADYRQGNKNYGNSYEVANNNWYSIHNPVTKIMISSGIGIPMELNNDEVYYNNISKSMDTKGLRDFHNLFVKKMLIMAVSKKGDTLIDFACGKGGDIPKWIKSELSFVFGIDISKDNLENRIDGICARYLNYKKHYKNTPRALFVNGNVGLNIQTGQAMLNDKAIQITKAIFGKGKKDSNLGIGVLKQYASGVDGFNVTSCQFAIHYLFENNKTFHGFLRNVAECTKLGGYFIGTCFDGKTIFNKLRKLLSGQNIEIYENGKKIFEIIKNYEEDTMEDEESCLGYKISVYQESINQLIPEYLVNFDYLNRIMEDYGFTIIDREEAHHLGLMDGSGMFNEMYNNMMEQIKRDKSKENEYGMASKMNNYEKDISFLNRYFVYKKNITVNAEKVSENFINRLPEEIEFERKETQKYQSVVAETIQEIRPKVKKLQKKIVLEANSVSPEVANIEPVASEQEIFISASKPKTKSVKKTLKKKPATLVIEP